MIYIGSTGSESDTVDNTEDKKSKNCEPLDLDNFLSEDEGKNDIELCTIVVQDENGREVLCRLVLKKIFCTNSFFRVCVSFHQKK